MPGDPAASGLIAVEPAPKAPHPGFPAPSSFTAAGDPPVSPRDADDPSWHPGRHSARSRTLSSAPATPFPALPAPISAEPEPALAAPFPDSAIPSPVTPGEAAEAAWDGAAAAGVPAVNAAETPDTAQTPDASQVPDVHDTPDPPDSLDDSAGTAGDGEDYSTGSDISAIETAIFELGALTGESPELETPGDPQLGAGTCAAAEAATSSAAQVPLTRRALREEQQHHHRPTPLKSVVRRRPTHPRRPGTTARRHAEAKAGTEVLDNVSLLARKSVRPVTAAAAAAVVATLVQAGLPNANPETPDNTEPEINALTPLRDTVELVAQRGVLKQASRSSLVRTVALGQEASLEVLRRSNSTITLSWANPKLQDGDTVVVRRTEGAKPAETIKDGVDVPLDNPQAAELLDQGLSPETEYSYAVFAKRADAKPQLVATRTETTRLYPNELRTGDSLIPGEKMVSENGRYSLKLDDDGGFYLVNKAGLRLWSPVESGATSLVQDSSGALTLSDDVTALWSTTTAADQAVTRLTNSGDIQVLEGDEVLWRRGATGSGVLGDDYPFSRGSPLGYSPHNCTDFVAWRLNRYAGVTEGPWKFAHRTMTPAGGNAVQWTRYFPNDTDDTPALGAVAWWGSNTGRGRGHVAIVAEIRTDGSILIEEYNFFNRGNYGTRVLRPGGSDWPAAFIHINDL
jgi:surface antigen